MHYEKCGHCDSPKIPGHGLVCTVTAISKISFWLGILYTLSFWAIALSPLVGIEERSTLALLVGVSAGLLLLISMATGMQARWLRHDLVTELDEYLDAEGSCCGGACAGTCGDEDGGGCCGGGCCGDEER